MSPLVPGERLALAQRANELGVDVVEAGFGDVPNDKPVLAILAAQFANDGPTISALVSAHSPIDLVVATAESISSAHRSRIHIYVNETEICDEEGRYRRDPAVLLDEAMASVELARDIADEVEFSPPQLRIPAAGLAGEWGEAAIASGAQIINIRSTAGSANPEGFLALVDEVLSTMPSRDRALLSADPFVPDRPGEVADRAATSCAEVAIGAGCRQVKGAILGVAATRGHPALEALVFQVWLRQVLDESRLWTNVDTTRLIDTIGAVATMKDMNIPRDQPVIGSATTNPVRTEFPDDPIERSLMAAAKRIVLRGLGLPIPLWLDEFAEGARLQGGGEQ